MIRGQSWRGLWQAVVSIRAELGGLGVTGMLDSESAVVWTLAGG
jgi:hypothetical protein